MKRASPASGVMSVVNAIGGGTDEIMIYVTSGRQILKDYQNK